MVAAVVGGSCETSGGTSRGIVVAAVVGVSCETSGGTSAQEAHMTSRLNKKMFWLFMVFYSKKTNQQLVR